MEQPKSKDTGLQGIIHGYNKIIDSYDLVIQDLSGEIYDPALRAKRGPVLDYLKTMRSIWAKCRDDAQRQIDAISGNSAK